MATDPAMVSGRLATDTFNVHEKTPGGRPAGMAVGRSHKEERIRKIDNYQQISTCHMQYRSTASLRGTADSLSSMDIRIADSERRPGGSVFIHHSAVVVLTFSSPSMAGYLYYGPIHRHDVFPGNHCLSG